jgi:hypothetical protein
MFQWIKENSISFFFQLFFLEVERVAMSHYPSDVPEESHPSILYLLRPKM